MRLGLRAVNTKNSSGSMENRPVSNRILASSYHDVTLDCTSRPTGTAVFSGMRNKIHDNLFYCCCRKCSRELHIVRADQMWTDECTNSADVCASMHRGMLTFRLHVVSFDHSTRHSVDVGPHFSLHDANSSNDERLKTMIITIMI